jgi:hypothetical protein
VAARYLTMKCQVCPPLAEYWMSNERKPRAYYRHSQATLKDSSRCPCSNGWQSTRGSSVSLHVVDERFSICVDHVSSDGSNLFRASPVFVSSLARAAPLKLHPSPASHSPARLFDRAPLRRDRLLFRLPFFPRPRVDIALIFKDTRHPLGVFSFESILGSESGKRSLLFARFSR